MNDNRKQAIVNEMIKSIESKGVVADARGKMWVIDRADNDSFLVTKYAHINYMIMHCFAKLTTHNI